MTERRDGHSKLVYDKDSRSLKTVDPHPPAPTAAELLTEIIDYFITAKESPGDFWAHDDSYQSYCLDHKARDGTIFWLDLEHDGTIRIVWQRPQDEKLKSMTFVARYGDPVGGTPPSPPVTR